MDERLEKFLEAPMVAWDSMRAIQPVNITTLVDCQGGVWDLKSCLGPCGGPATCQSNPYRVFWYCERHAAEGILILQHRGNIWCWLSGNLEKKK